jgi:bifunctional non-homologous end joining protein LigD
MGLRDYFKKRAFSKTPEPKGGKHRSTNHKLAFVVQEHHASRLHYDFRLELDGVLKSWAVPKGPSLDPHEHHLAVHVEDHPYEYRTFEGVIPEGNYGAGNVIIWDEGWYEARADADDDEAELRKEYKKGHMSFVLHGKKLKGEFALIQMHGKDEDAWLLVKKNDDYATTADVTRQDKSVKSHKKVDELGAFNKIPDLKNYPARKQPWKVKPMLATLVDEPFSKENWLFEIKWDGFRAIGSKHGDDIDLYSRLGNDFMAKYSPVAEALRGFKRDVIVDGEIVVVDQGGNAHFEWLQNWRRDPQGELHYYLFDIVWCDGHDVRSMPLAQRKQLLKSVIPKSNVLHYSDHIEAEGEKLFAEMERQGLEGMVAKNGASTYQEDVRGPDWLKVKTRQRQEVVIGGYTEPRGGRKYLGSLVAGVYDNGELHYVGHSGGGIPDEQRRELRDRLAKMERKTSPFVNTPKPNAPVHWVKPELVAEMSFSEWTKEDYMRQPQFKGLRSDKKPQAVHREKSKHTQKQVAATHAGDLPFEQTHTDKVFFPKHAYTKGDMATYYESVADYILPYIKDRPCSLNRMPNGINGESFYQKNNEHLPNWVPHADIFSESNNGNLRWIVGKDLNTLLYMVQLGCVEINPWNSRVGKLDYPDWIVIDLDPEGVSFKGVVEVARTVKEVCDDWGIAAYPKTSGKTGIHIYIPMGAKYTYEQGKNLAHLIAIGVNTRQPKLTSVERMPEKRKNKIYVDFLQNREGQTLAAPYSLRPTPDATVSMPLHWDEVIPSLKPTDFTINNAPRRLSRVGDLWAPALATGVDLPAILKRIG